MSTYINNSRLTSLFLKKTSLRKPMVKCRVQTINWLHCSTLNAKTISFCCAWVQIVHWLKIRAKTTSLQSTPLSIGLLVLHVAILRMCIKLQGNLLLKRCIENNTGIIELAGKAIIASWNLLHTYICIIWSANKLCSYWLSYEPSHLIWLTNSPKQF